MSNPQNTDEKILHKRRKNVEYVKRYKATRDRVELYLPQGLRDQLKEKVAASGYGSVQSWFVEVAETFIKTKPKKKS